MMIILKNVSILQSFSSIAWVLFPSITIVAQLFTREWFFGCGRTLVDLRMELQ